jgi:zinc protease
MLNYNMKETSLKNGVKLLFNYSGDDDLIAINLFFPVGIEVDSKIKGIGSFTCSMLFKGNKDFDKEKLSYELEKNGMHLDWERGDDYINFSLLLHKNCLNNGLKLFFDLINYPVFPEEEISSIKQEYLHALSSRYDSIYNVAFDLFVNNIYGENYPYSWLSIGNKDSINSITKNDLINFHKNYFNSKNAVITVMGNCDYDEVSKIINDNFNKLEYLESEKKLYKNIKAELKENIIRVKKDFNQAYVMYGFSAPDVNDKNFVPMKIINNYLGSGMSSQMFSKIREELGLVYEIHAQFPSKLHTGYWLLYMGLDKENIDLSILTIEDELKNLVLNSIDDKNLERIKTKMISQYFLMHEKKMQRGFYTGFWEVLGKSWRYDIDYIKEIENVSKQDIKDTLDTCFAKSLNKTKVIVEPMV